MKINVLLLVTLLMLTCFVARSQDVQSEEKKSGLDVRLEGMLGVSFGRDFYSVNVGGPGLFLVLNKNWKIGVGALPSLYLLNGKFGARLGVSPRIDYKNFVFIAPFFHRDKTEEWICSVGFGYKFHQKKSN